MALKTEIDLNAVESGEIMKTKQTTNARKIFIFAIVALAALYALVSAAATGSLPSACNGQWSSCTNAFSDNTNRATATATNTANKSGVWRNYGFSIPASNTIDSVTVRADFFATNFRGYIDVRVSGDGGLTYGQSHIVGGNTAEQSFLIDVSSDLAWTPSMLNNSNFRVNATCHKVGAGTNPGCRLDWLPVNVTYTAPFDFSLSAIPASASIAQAKNASTSVVATLTSGDSRIVALSHTGCPPSAQCSFNVSEGNPTFLANFKVATSPSTPTGTYVVGITGVNDSLTRETNFTVTVTDSFPVASPFANPSSGNAPLAVNFNGTVTGGDAPFTYFWDFNDNSNSTSQNPQHTYTAAGLYNASFTATDFDGDFSSGSVLINVTSTPFDFSVFTIPTGTTIANSTNTTVWVVAFLLSGNSRIVTLSQTGCPPSAMCLFNTTEGNPSFLASLNIATSAATPVGNYTINITGVNDTLVRNAIFTLNVTT